MKWFFTGDSGPIAEQLLSSGHEIVGSSDLYRDTDEAEDSREYPIKRIIRDLEPFDVLGLVDLLNPVGYWKGGVLPWSGAIRGRCVVGFAFGPDASWRARNAMRGCSMNVSHCGVVVCDHRDQAEFFTRYAKTVYWDGKNIDPIIRAAFDYCNYIHDVPRLYEAISHTE
jgi:hypothetical protein